MTNEGSDSRPRLSQRARIELARAGEAQWTGAGAVFLGLIVGLVAIGLKAIMNQVAGGDTGYVLLVAAALVAAWFGGLPGGGTTILTVFLLNAIFLLGTQEGFVQISRLELTRDVQFLVASAGSVWLVASRRTSRDHLAKALADVSSMADEIEARDRRLELMLAASGTGFWEWDVSTGHLTWSDAIFEQHGLEPSDLAPDFETYLGMIHEGDRERFASSIQAATEGGDDFDLDFRVLWPDGSEHWTRTAGRVFHDPAGRAQRVIGTGQDITTGKQLEAERDRLLAEERRAGEFREAFIDVISHELRTPITTILGTTEILSRPDRVVDADVRMTMLADARAESERLYRLVEDLLVLSRVERGRLVVDPEPLQLRRLLERVVAHMSSELPSVTIVLDAPEALPIVSGEVTYVEQVLRNLLENAAKYSPSGSHVSVSAEQVGTEVIVQVLDDGPGIPAASVDHIFDLFYRDPVLARTVAGSGIGLFVCRSLVEAMGGRMSVVPAPGGGARFSFGLPVLDDDEGDVIEAAVR